MMTDLEKRLLRILTASAEQLAAIDRVLDGKMALEREVAHPPAAPPPVAPPPRPEPPKGPLLMMVKDAANLLGVHRTTIWRLMKAGRLEAVDLLGHLRVRRADVEALAGGRVGGG